MELPIVSRPPHTAALSPCLRHNIRCIWFSIENHWSAPCTVGPYTEYNFKYNSTMPEDIHWKQISITIIIIINTYGFTNCCKSVRGTCVLAGTSEMTYTRSMHEHKASHPLKYESGHAKLTRKSDKILPVSRYHRIPRTNIHPCRMYTLAALHVKLRQRREAKKERKFFLLGYCCARKRLSISESSKSACVSINF